MLLTTEAFNSTHCFGVAYHEPLGLTFAWRGDDCLDVFRIPPGGPVEFVYEKPFRCVVCSTSYVPDCFGFLASYPSVLVLYARDSVCAATVFRVDYHAGA